MNQQKIKMDKIINMMMSVNNSIKWKVATWQLCKVWIRYDAYDLAGHCAHLDASSSIIFHLCSPSSLSCSFDIVVVRYCHCKQALFCVLCAFHHFYQSHCPVQILWQIENITWPGENINIHLSAHLLQEHQSIYV